MESNKTYTKQQEEFLIKNYRGISRKELAKKFNIAFNESRGERAIKGWCNRRGLHSDNDGRFKKGNISWQKGLSKEEFKARYTEKSFNKMMAGITDKRIHAIGDEIKRHGEWCVVTSTQNNKEYDKRMTSKRRYIYEKQHGQIPDNHRIIHLDGDHENFNIDNLYCIPARYVGGLNKKKWLNKSKEITLAAIKWCELHEMMKDEFKTSAVQKTMPVVDIKKSEKKLRY
jgi:hypothetical protein